MKQAIVECVPNFSEGRDMHVVAQIAESIGSVEGVRVLNVDPGAAANRTVITFAGRPEAVVEAAFRAVGRAARLIDMRRHTGTHPRIGATDVLPLVPVEGIALEECARLARGLAQRIADELGIPTYCYEAAALRPQYANLAVCRAGEYESLPQKLADPLRGPDFGPRQMTEAVGRGGATVVGARKFLIAVNFNLDTRSAYVAHDIALDLRTKGRPVTDSGAADGILRTADGRPVMRPGRLKACKALGWYIDEYGIAQVSMNLTDMDVTPLHEAYEAVCRAAAERGVRVTGTEIIGLVPERALLEAGAYFLEKEGRAADVPAEELVAAAIAAMGLNDLREFVPAQKVVEYRLSAAE